MAAVSQMPVEVPQGGVAAPDLVTPAAPAPAQTVSAKPGELEARAAEYVGQERFNRRFTLPATEAHGELCVTYAVGGRDRADAPTLLFIGGMMGGRHLASMADHVCAEHGMRIVVTDRPGLGGSTPVEPSLRLSVWLETVPALMRTLGARHISISAHSCGVMYALNTIYAMPEILPPSNRKLYLIAPWVPPEHSGAALWSISSRLPSALINTFDSLIRFVNGTVLPTVNFSAVMSTAVAAPFSKPNPNACERGGHSHECDDAARKWFGVSAAENAARSKVLMRRVFGENIRGCNHEALLCLRKDVAGSWGACDDYEKYGDLLETKLQAQTEEGGSAGRLGLKAFFAERDNMIGKKGERYFDQCFQRFTRDAPSTDGEHPSRLSYESESVPGTEHDTVCLPQHGVLTKILEDILGEPR